MKKISFLLCVCLSLYAYSHAQSAKPFKALSIEGGKTGAIAHVTFDRKNATSQFGFRLFAGSNFGRYVQLINAGGGIYYLVGKGTKFLELGTDVSLLLVDVVSDDQFRAGNLVVPAKDIQTLYTSFNIGYRRYGNKTLFRFGLAPGFTKEGWLPGGYISLGVRF